MQLGPGGGALMSLEAESWYIQGRGRDITGGGAVTSHTAAGRHPKQGLINAVRPQDACEQIKALSH